MRNIIITTLLTVGFLIVGFLFFGQFLQILLPKFDNGFYSVESIPDQYRQTVLFSIVFGCIPLFIALTWKFGRIKSNNSRIKSLTIVIASLILFVIFKREWIKFDLSNATIKSITYPHAKISAYPLDQAGYTLYILTGLIVGCVLSYLVLRKV